jgi:hypothetical protein
MATGRSKERSSLKLVWFVEPTRLPCHGSGLFAAMLSGGSDEGLPDGKSGSAMDAEFNNMEDIIHGHMGILDSFTASTPLQASIHVRITALALTPNAPSRHPQAITQHVRALRLRLLQLPGLGLPGVRRTRISVLPPMRQFSPPILSLDMGYLTVITDAHMRWGPAPSADSSGNPRSRRARPRPALGEPRCQHGDARIRRRC